ncbi:hypothetical protein V1520DRAFT_366453 [Lipomyces starkeyi]|uniref:Major facilitator superfamily (MFS) profile domain-containing protein n=1 Tax=Lipomyces starkeyi NRRL Y-11557 TaxID=675824 RepID=A0A1E3PX20_LIPST|nr:hypothetical protein LIPSTDRAFT_66122 [Lipomyces starkeyi NRRL Y-11557]
MTKSMLSIVWVAGPLSGLIMQPVVGVWSDECTSRYGRRRPFMVIGSVIVGLSLMLMAWTREFVDIFVKSERWSPTVTIVFAVLSVFAADFSVNAVQACCRAIIVDSLPKSKQELANAWAGRMVAGGHLIGYFAGVINLVDYFPYLGNTQLKVLCAISSLALLLCVGLTSWAVDERVLILTNEADKSKSIYHILKALLETGFHLPTRIRQIFTVQLFAWYGWFTFLFYSSTWVGEIFVRYGNGDLTDSRDRVGAIGRVGSLALTVYSTITLICSLILPFFIVPPNSDAHHNKATYENMPDFIADFLHAIAPFRPTLPTAWVIGQLVYALAMFGTVFVKSVKAATFVVGLCGFSWALSSWAPYSLLAEEIRKLNSTTTVDGYESVSPEELPVVDEESVVEAPRRSRQLVATPEQGKDYVGATPLDSTSSAGSPTAGPSDAIPISGIPYSVDDISSLSDEDDVATNEESEESSEQAGIYLGLHNVSITIPQFVSTFMSFVIFSILDPGKSEELTGDGDEQSRTGVDAIGVTLRLGGITALVSAYMAWKLRK